MTKQEERRVSALTSTTADIMVAQEQLRRAEEHEQLCSHAAVDAMNVWSKGRQELMRRVREDLDPELIESGVQACATLETVMHDADHKWRQANRDLKNARSVLNMHEGKTHPGLPVKPKRKGWFKRAAGWMHKKQKEPFNGYELMLYSFLWLACLWLISKVG